MKEIIMGILILMCVFMVSCEDDSNPTGNNENHAPTITLPEKFSLTVNDTLEINFADYVEDEDGDDLTLSVSGNSEITILITGLFVEIFAPTDWTGSETAVFSVDDGSIAEPVSAAVLIEVQNLLGTVISLENITTAAGTEFYIRMNTSIIDPDWNVISYQCTLSFDNDFLSYSGVNQTSTITNGMLLGNENVPGEIIIACAGTESIEGEGALVNIGFNAEQPGETEIEIIKFTYNNSSLENLINGTVTIE